MAGRNPAKLGAELGDAGELKAHRETYQRWEAATKRVGELRQQHARAEAADRQTETDFAAGKTRKLPEPTAPPLEAELSGAMRAVDVLEPELVQAGRRLFAAALAHVPAAEAALVARLDEHDERVEGCSARRSRCSTNVRSRRPRPAGCTARSGRPRSSRTCRGPRVAG